MNADGILTIVCTKCDGTTQAYQPPLPGQPCWHCEKGERILLTTLQEWALLGRFFVDKTK